MNTGDLFPLPRKLKPGEILCVVRVEDLFEPDLECAGEDITTPAASITSRGVKRKLITSSATVRTP